MDVISNIESSSDSEDSRVDEASGMINDLLAIFNF